MDFRSPTPFPVADHPLVEKGKKEPYGFSSAGIEFTDAEDALYEAGDRATVERFDALFKAARQAAPIEYILDMGGNSILGFPFSKIAEIAEWLTGARSHGDWELVAGMAHRIYDGARDTGKMADPEKCLLKLIEKPAMLSYDSGSGYGRHGV